MKDETQQSDQHPFQQPPEDGIVQPQEQEEQTVETDCNVCYTTMVEPCTLPCQHSFCLLCIRTFFQTKSECPLCRAVPPANYELSVNLNLQKVVKKTVPEAYKKQLAALRAQNAFSGDWLDLKLVYGNRHESVAADGYKHNTHKWTMFVKFANKDVNANSLIEKVRFGLHPTFGMDFMDVKAGPSGKFEMGFTGWGTFDIPTTIHFKRELCLEPA